MKILWYSTFALMITLFFGCSLKISAPEGARSSSEINSERFLKKDGGYIVHIFPMGKSQPPGAWQTHLQKLKDFYVDKEIIIHVGLMPQQSKHIAQQRAYYLWDKYREYGAKRVAWSFVRQASASKLLPHYDEYCKSLPVLILENDGGSRMMTFEAESPIDQLAIEQLAGRTVVVVLF